MDKFKKMIALVIMTIAVIRVSAQPVKEEPVDFMHSNGKIYVVVAIVLTILIGLFIYLISLDRKIGKLENKSK
jgi:hypothetical protein